MEDKLQICHTVRCYKRDSTKLFFSERNIKVQITRLLYIKHVVSFSKKTYVFEHICDQNPPKKAPLNVLTKTFYGKKRLMWFLEKLRGTLRSFYSLKQ